MAATGLTADEFRALALGLPGTTEGVHQGHPDFRVRGKVFATLGYPDDSFGMVKLTSDEQAKRVRQMPTVFSVAKGQWGVQGSTLIKLEVADATSITMALQAAWSGLIKKESEVAVNSKPRSGKR